MDERYLFTDRPEAARGQEDDSESAWREFQALASGRALPAGEMHAGEPAAQGSACAAAGSRQWDVESVLSLARLHNRVCPKPPQWFAMHALLKEHAPAGDAPPPPPADPLAWTRTSSLAKAICFGDHVRWAAGRPGALGRVAELLVALREDEWHHKEIVPSAHGR